MSAANGLSYGAVVGLATFTIVASLTFLGWVVLDPFQRKWLTVKAERDEALAQLAETEAQLADARRRERMALNLLAYVQDLEHPFPAAGSLGDEVEAWLANPTEQ